MILRTSAQRLRLDTALDDSHVLTRHVWYDLPLYIPACTPHVSPSGIQIKTGQQRYSLSWMWHGSWNSGVTVRPLDVRNVATSVSTPTLYAAGSRVKIPAMGPVTLIYCRSSFSTVLPGHQWVPGDLSLGVKRPGREADHSLPSSAEVKECVELYLHSNNMSSWRGA
jgi:hypothetical protein